MSKSIGVGIFIILALFLSDASAEGSREHELEPIIITKSRVHLLVPYTLTEGFLEKSPYKTPIASLSIMPIDLQSRSLTGDIQTDFSLRASTFQGVLMLINGQRINDPQTGHFNSDIPFTKEDIQRIDVLPGVGSAVFGPDSIGGAVNFVIKKPRENKCSFVAGGGDHNTASGSFSIEHKFDKIGLRYSIEKEVSSGFGYDTEFKTFTNSFASSIDLPNGNFDLNFGYQDKVFGAYDFYTPGSGYPSKEWTRVLLTDASLNINKYGFLIRPNFLWRRHYDKFMLDKTEARSLYVNHHRTDIFTPNIYLQKDAGILGKLGTGLEYGQERISSTNLGKHIRAHRSIFMDDSKDITQNLLFGMSVRMDDFDGFGAEWTGSGSLKFKLSDINSLSLGVSRSIRVPSFTELYYSDPTTLGNSSLSAEKSINYQAGYDYKSNNISAGLTLFFRQEYDFIDWVKHSPAQTMWQAENITNAQVPGAELYFKLKVNSLIDFNSNYTYANKRTDEPGLVYKYGINYSRHIANAGLSFKLPFGTQALTLSYKKKPGRSGWLLLNSHFSYDFNKNAEVFVDITNLLNISYEEIVGIPQPGRWVQGGFRIAW